MLMLIGELCNLTDELKNYLNKLHGHYRFATSQIAAVLMRISNTSIKPSISHISSMISRPIFTPINDSTKNQK